LIVQAGNPTVLLERTLPGERGGRGNGGGIVLDAHVAAAHGAPPPRVERERPKERKAERRRGGECAERGPREGTAERGKREKDGTCIFLCKW
jgi:hypothetical protein